MWTLMNPSFVIVAVHPISVDAPTTAQAQAVANRHSAPATVPMTGRMVVPMVAAPGSDATLQWKHTDWKSATCML
jgi:hypothetical protein